MRKPAAGLLLAAISVGCTVSVQGPAAIPATSAVAATLPPSSTPTFLPTTQPTAPAPTAAPFVPFEVNTWAGNVLLRTNPGYLFPRLRTLDEGTILTVLGRSPGGEWLLVQTRDNQVGWVFTELVESEAHDLRSAPEIQPAEAQLVTGHVRDASGGPISGIQFALVQGSGSNAPRTDAMTDESGTFYAFMPKDASGSWWVSYTAISCKSNIMDADCNWVGKPFPEGMYIELPLQAGSAPKFSWR